MGIRKYQKSFFIVDLYNSPRIFLQFIFFLELEFLLIHIFTITDFPVIPVIFKFLAERLINELKKLDLNTDENLKHRLLSNFHLLATKEKANVELALENLITLASETANKENIEIIYGKSSKN